MGITYEMKFYYNIRELSFISLFSFIHNCLLVLLSCMILRHAKSKQLSSIFFFNCLDAISSIILN